MDDLITWLRAQLDEDEALAREAVDEVGDARWKQRGARIVTASESGGRSGEVADFAIVECILHIVRHDPARELQRVAADRAILAHIETELGHDGDHEWWLPATLEPIVRHLASAYADRPGYRDEWRP